MRTDCEDLWRERKLQLQSWLHGSDMLGSGNGQGSAGVLVACCVSKNTTLLELES